MLNAEKLKQVIDERGISITKLVKSLGITRESFYNKLNGVTEFKASEILKTTKALNMNRDTRDAIFFSEEGELNSHSKNVGKN